MSSFFDKIFSLCQCGFRKGFNPQHCLVAMIENWKTNTDLGKSYGDLLTDLSKAFYYLLHEVLITNLETYVFSKTALKIMHSYLFNRKQRVKISALYSIWRDILLGVM